MDRKAYPAGPRKPSHWSRRLACPHGAQGDSAVWVLTSTGRAGGWGGWHWVDTPVHLHVGLAASLGPICCLGLFSHLVMNTEDLGQELGRI